MCLIAFAIEASAQWPLVIAANRDESYDRPTLPLSLWTAAEGQEIASGRDARAGGTWLGLTPTGRIAFLTNVRDGFGEQLAALRSRGELVTRWLESDMDAEVFMASTDPSSYGGCNLVLGDWPTGKWTWLSNRVPAGLSQGEGLLPGRSAEWLSQPLPPGIYGLSNAALDTPWPKTQALKKALVQSLEMPDMAQLKDRLWTALDSRERAAENELPHTGVPAASEHALSSAFVEMPERAYGTRCSTLVLARRDSDGTSMSLDINEKTHLPFRSAEDAGEHLRDGAFGLAMQWNQLKRGPLQAA